MKDPAFQSQQFAQDSNRRKEAYILAGGQAIQQGLPAAIGQFQQGQQHAQQMELRQQSMQLEQMKTQSIVASQQADRQLAMENLAFAREIHSTDMIAAQKRIAVAQAGYEEARLGQLKDELQHPKFDPNMFRPEHILGMRRNGYTMTFEGGRPTPVKISKEEQDAAGRQYDSYIQAKTTPTAGARDETALTRLLENDEISAEHDIKQAQEIIANSKETADRKREAKQKIDAAQHRLDRANDMREKMIKGAAERRGYSAGADTPNGVVNSPNDSQRADDDTVKAIRELFEMLNKPGSGR